MRLGDWADDVAFQDTGGSVSNQQAAAGQMPATGSFIAPAKNQVTTMPWMNLITGALNQGNAAGNTFTQGVASFQRPPSVTPYVLAGMGLLGVGILAYALTRK